MIQFLTPLLTILISFYLAALAEALKNGADRRTKAADQGSADRDRALRARTRAELVRITAGWIFVASLIALIVASLLKVTQ